MKKYEIGFAFQNQNYLFVYQDDTFDDFPDPKQMYGLCVLEAQKLLDPVNPSNDVELLSISRIS